MFERAFVLLPLSEIAPGLRFPDGTTVEERLADEHIHDQIGRGEITRLSA
jgi:7,8-dihydro-6-hydroxymethylpterin-pyrophosphokinase